MSDLSKYVGGNYDIVYMDPAWPMYGDPNKNAAAGKHYDLMSFEDICDMPIKDICADKAAVFVWATCPRLDIAIKAIESWGLHFRGVPFVWVKTRKDGVPIGPMGVPPTSTKPVSELVLLATTNKRGRPLVLQSSKVRQVVFAPRGKHSSKPEEVRERIEEVYGSDCKKLELFSRNAASGWTCSGSDLNGDVY